VKKKNRHGFRVMNMAKAAGQSWFTVITNSDKNEPAEVMIYGEIGTGWDGTSGVDAKAFADEFKAIPAGKPINLRIHSPGGSVWDGLAIYNIIDQRRADVSAKVDGIALSAASFIAMAAKTLEMPKTARMMIHDAQGLVIGNSKRMQEAADLLNAESDNIAAIYHRKTGKDVKRMREMMAAETWMNGQEAKDNGFVDTVTDATVQNCTFDLSRFKQVPSELVANKHTTDNDMNKQLVVALLAKLGVTNVTKDSDDNTLTAALDNAVASGKLSPANLRFAVKADAKETDAWFTAIPQAQAAPPPAAPLQAPLPQNNGNANPQIVNLPPGWNVVKGESPNAIAALTAQVARERELRITNEVNGLLEDRPYLDKAEWLPKCIQDENMVKSIRALPVFCKGAEPVAISNWSNNGISLVDNYQKMKPGAERNKFRVANFAELRRMESHFGDPRMANSYSATLVTDFLADAIIQIAHNRLAPLSMFTRNFGTDRGKPMATVEVRKPTAGATTQTDATNFESGDSTTVAVSVTMHQYSQSFHVTNDQYNKGHMLEQVALINAQAFADKLSDLWTALLVAANWAGGAGLTLAAVASFDPGDLPPIWSAAKNFRQKNLILDGAYLAFLLPQNTFAFNMQPDGTFGTGAFGFDKIGQQNRWTGATASTQGFIAAPDAIALASGLPKDLPAGEFMGMSTVTLDGLGLTVQLCFWFSKATRTFWASYDVHFGAAIGDSTSGKVLIGS
jgi:ATP-dependent protease ClpP protease subunit